MRLRQWKLLYILAGATWVAYWVRFLLSIPADQRNPDPRAFFVCLVVFIAPPAAGYFLLFHVFPWAGKFLRQRSR